MHLAERMRLPKPFTALPYRGSIDHPAMCTVLASHRAHGDGTETPTVEQLDAMYANLTNCNLDRDLVVVESGSEPTRRLIGVDTSRQATPGETPTIAVSRPTYGDDVHVADHHHLPEGYRARPYAGAVDHPAMTTVLAAYRDHLDDPELPTIEQMDAAYAHLTHCDPATDIALIEHDGDVVAYARPNRGGSGDDPFECVLFTPAMPAHLRHDVFDAMMTAQETHTRPWAAAVDGAARFRAFAGHPGPGLEPTGEAAWLEARGYEAVEWEATLARPDLENIPELRLPPGVELRPVEPEQMRQIWEAHWESFRGEWDFQEATPEAIDAEMAEPYIDHTLWKVAWVGDEIVGQVKSYINHVENDLRGYRRGYAEYISTHHDWRNRGIAGALLAMSLVELRDRGMTEAVLGVDTNNPGGAFQLYTKLGFELSAYAAIYAKGIA